MRVTPKSLYLTADFDSFLARGLFELFLYIYLQGPISFYFKHERNFTNSFLIRATFTSSTGVCVRTQTPKKKKLFKFAWIRKKISIIPQHYLATMELY